MGDPVKEASWEEFRKAGLLWWVNRFLHVLGWAIVVEMNDDGKHVCRAYPARVSYRGFAPLTETDGFAALTKHIEQELPRLKKEVGGI